MLRIEGGSAFLLRRAQRNGYHVDLYVYDLYLRLDRRRAELAPFEKLECVDVKGSFSPSRLQLQTARLGFLLTAERRAAGLELHLQIQAPNPGVVAGLIDWTSADEFTFRRSISPDAAEQEILSLATLLRAYVPVTGGAL
jgi:hypothetical protein